MAETLTIRTASSTEVVKIAVPGPQGIPGVGVPTGGSALQVLRKKTSTDYDTEWAAAGSGSGSVTSVALSSTDLTISGSPITDSGTITANIAANAVTLEKLQTISSQHLLGRHGSGNGGVQQIGLGTGLAMSGSNVGVTFGSSAGTACQGNDSRLSDSRTPTAHAASHASAGSDPLAPSDIGAQCVFSYQNLTITGNTTLTAARAKIYDVSAFSGTPYNLTLPTTGNQVGDIVALRIGFIASTSIVTIKNDTTTVGSLGEYAFRRYRFVNETGAADGWQIDIVPIHTQNLSDPEAIIGTLPVGNLPVGTTSSHVAAGNHTHELTALAATGATNGHVLTANGSNGATFAALPASGVTGAASSASDVLGVSGANITGVDANADRIVYWNNTSNKLAYGTPADAGAAAASHTHAASDITSGLAASATTDTTNASNISSGTLAPARMGSGTPSASNYLRGDGSWQVVSAGVSGSTGNTANSVLRASGTGGSTLQSSGLVVEDTVTSFTTVTGDASTDIVTATGSAFVNGQKVRFTALTGGSGLNTTTNYYVISVNGATFQLSTTEGGSAVNFTTNITAGTLLTGHAVTTLVAITNNSSDTNSSLVLTPRGYGAVIFGPVPSGTQTTKNARGLYAFDAQLDGGDGGTGASQVASGGWSAAFGRANQASGNYSFCGAGFSNSATNTAAAIFGQYGLASGIASLVAGEQCRATTSYTTAFGYYSLADRLATIAQAAGVFAARGDAQRIHAVLRNKTTTNSAVELFLDGSSTRLTVPSGKAMAMLINITGVKSDGSAVAHYVRQYCLKNVGGTTSEVYAPVTIGTDNAAGTSIAVEANDTNDALRINVTGITSETWRWVASVDAVEVAYGT